MARLLDLEAMWGGKLWAIMETRTNCMHLRNKDTQGSGSREYTRTQWTDDLKPSLPLGDFTDLWSWCSKLRLLAWQNRGPLQEELSLQAAPRIGVYEYINSGVLPCKELRNHRSCPYNTKAQDNEKQWLFLDSQEKWGHRANHHPEIWRERGEYRKSQLRSAYLDQKLQEPQSVGTA